MDQILNHEDKEAIEQTGIDTANDAITSAKDDGIHPLDKIDIPGEGIFDESPVEVVSDTTDEIASEEEMTKTVDAGEPVETQTAEGEQTEEDISDDLLNIGVELGLDETQIRKLGSEGLAIARMVMDRQLAEIGRKAGQPKDDVPADKGSKQEFKIDLGEGADPDLQAALEAMGEHYSKQLDQVIQTVEQFSRQVAGKESIEAGQQFSEMVKGLGDEWSDVFGKTDTPRGIHRMNRDGLRQEMEAIANGHASVGRTLSTKDQFDRALLSLFPGKIQALARQDVANAVSNRKSQRISRPTSRQQNIAADNTSRAIAATREKMKEMGWT